MTEQETERTPQEEVTSLLSLLTVVAVILATATVALFMFGHSRFGVITTVATFFTICAFAALNSARWM